MAESRSARHLRHFARAVGSGGASYDALSWCYGITTTWEAVRRVASTIVEAEVTDIGLAWAIVRHERAVRGDEVFDAQVAETLARWRAEVEA